MNYKIRVSNKEHSELVQDIFFKKGHKWSGSHTTPYKHSDKTFLFIDIYDMDITYSEDESYFDKHKYLEIKTLHPLQREFLNQYGKNKIYKHVQQILDNGYYKLEDREILNRTLQSKIYKQVQQILDNGYYKVQDQEILNRTLQSEN